MDHYYQNQPEPPVPPLFSALLVFFFSLHVSFFLLRLKDSY